MKFGVRIEGAGPALDYSFTLDRAHGLLVSQEHLAYADADEGIITRDGRIAFVLNEADGKREQVRGFPGASLLLTGFGFKVPHAAIRRTVRALSSMDVQLPFEVVPTWAARECGRESGMRISSPHQRRDALVRFGRNLASVFSQLKFDPVEWQRVMTLIHLGLGEDIEDLNIRQVAAGEGISLWIKYSSFEKEVPASSLSDGTLDYLAFVALSRVVKQRSLLVVDEPEVHLHPALLARVVDLLQATSLDSPVLVTTHSDRLLNHIRSPEESIVLCRLDEKRATQLMRPDPSFLPAWLEAFDGDFGNVRENGFRDWISVL